MESVMKRVSILRIVFGIWIVLIPWISLNADADPLSEAGVLRFNKGVSAPDFAIKDVEGRLRNLKEFRGKVVLLDFWATW